MKRFNVGNWLIIVVLALSLHLAVFLFFAVGHKNVMAMLKPAKNNMQSEALAQSRSHAEKSQAEAQAPAVEAKADKKAEPANTPIRHTVKEGEWLAKIGRQYGVSWQRIFEANKDQINDPNVIKPGQVITIPAPESAEAVKTAVGVKESAPQTVKTETSPSGEIRVKSADKNEATSLPVQNKEAKTNKSGKHSNKDISANAPSNADDQEAEREADSKKQVFAIPAPESAEAVKTAVGAKQSASETVKTDVIRSWRHMGGNPAGPHRSRVKFVEAFKEMPPEIKKAFIEKIKNGDPDDEIHKVLYGQIHNELGFGNMEFWGKTRAEWVKWDAAQRKFVEIESQLAVLYRVQDGERIYELVFYHECHNPGWWVRDAPSPPTEVKKEPPKEPPIIEEEPPAIVEVPKKVEIEIPKPEVKPAAYLMKKLHYYPEPVGWLVKVFATVLERKEERGPHLELITEYRFDRAWDGSGNNHGFGAQLSVYTNNYGDWWFGPAGMFNSWWGQVDTYRYNGYEYGAGAAVKYEKPWWNIKAHAFLGNLFEDARDDFGLRSKNEFRNVLSADLSASTKNVNSIIPFLEEVNLAVFGRLDPGDVKSRTAVFGRRVKADVLGKDYIGARADFDFQSWDVGKNGLTLTLGTGFVYDRNEYDSGYGPFATLALGQRQLNRESGEFKYHYPPRKYLKVYFGVDLARRTYLGKFTLFVEEAYYAWQDANMRESLRMFFSSRDLTPEQEMLKDLRDAEGGEKSGNDNQRG